MATNNNGRLACLVFDMIDSQDDLYHQALVLTGEQAPVAVRAFGWAKRTLIEEKTVKPDDVLFLLEYSDGDRRRYDGLDIRQVRDLIRKEKMGENAEAWLKQATRAVKRNELPKEYSGDVSGGYYLSVYPWRAQERLPEETTK